VTAMIIAVAKKTIVDVGIIAKIAVNAIAITIRR
tara:strand:- start:22255 stop:22356 length:102 start_codon:yes stop_codon:yes gene_type:complete